MNRSLITMAALVLAPCLALGQEQSSADTSRAGTRGDSTWTGAAPTQPGTTGAMSDTTISSAEGSIATNRRASSANRRAGLTSAQVRELQQAINDAGCSAGPVDGQLGPQTEQGIQCVRQKKGLTGSSASELYDALGLSFGEQAGRSSLSANGEIYSGEGTANATANVKGQRYQTGGRNSGRIRPPSDSAAQSATPTTPPSAAQRGQGMHDSTTSADTSARDTTSLNEGVIDSSVRDTTVRDTSRSDAILRDSAMRDSSMRDTSMSPTPTDTGMTGAPSDSLSADTATGDVVPSDTSARASDSSDSRRVSPPSISGSVAPSDTTKLNTSPVDSARMGVPQTREMNRQDSASQQDSARAQSDTTRPPR